MKTVALISGGKDSCFNMMQCVSEGHEIVALANLKPKVKDELDSYMYQTVGHQAIDLYAEAMGLPLYRRTIQGGSVNQSRDYMTTQHDEVEDLFQLLKQIKEEMDIEAVSVGAILSDYQRVRVEHVCSRLGLTALAYLWRRDQKELLNDMISNQLHAVLIKVAALGLSQKHLGKSLAEMQDQLLKLEHLYGLHPCGEGGEYETFTLDCPLFKKSIVIDKKEMVLHSDDDVAPVAYLNLTQLHLEDKPEAHAISGDTLVGGTPHTSRILDQLFPQSVPDVCTENDNKLTEEHQAPITLFQYDMKVHEKMSKDWLYISCITGSVKDGASVEEQTTAAMNRLSGCLSRNGLEMSHLVAVHVYVKNMSDFARINSVYRTYFEINPPIRVCVGVNLAHDVSLQIDAVAYRGEHRTMHVQSVSHWAPANIGPYSQATQVLTDRVYVAGQIALVPGSMRLLGSGIRAQARLSVRHVDRVLCAMQAPVAAPLNLACVRLAICYVVEPKFIQVAREEWQSYMQEALQDDNGFSSRVRTLMEFVVVSALPRGALIEWQVVATPYTANITEYTSHRESEGLQASCKINCSHSENGSTVTLICKLNSHDFAIKDVDSAEDSEMLCLTLTFMCMKDVLPKISGVLTEDMLPHMGTLRIFYNMRVFNIGQLLKAYEDAWRRVFDCDSPPPAYIPVSALADSNQLLSVCH